MLGAPVSEVLFAGHSGLYRCESLMVSILPVCEIRSAGFKQERLLLVTAYLS